MREHSGLLTDLYELTMAAGYSQTRFQARATFELFVRHLPPRWSYLVAAGLEQALEFLEGVRFTPDEIAFLRRHPAFQHVREDFFRELEDFRFAGDVWAVPEGTIVFPGEPLLRLTAPIGQAQIIETYLLAAIGYQTLVASKAARVVTAATGREVVEFGARRAHGPQASLWASRAAVIGGCRGTSHVLAGQLYGLETYGTQAHSWIMAHEREDDAFRNFVEVFPGHSVLLLDTYDLRKALPKILRLPRRPAGVRLDSGDLARDSRWVRERLDAAGWRNVKIFASGDLDEFRIASLLRRKPKIDAFGVGGAIVLSTGALPLSIIYKLVELEQDGRIRGAAKFSEAKATYPGRKQVFRRRTGTGLLKSDLVALDSETDCAPGQKRTFSCEPLLIEVMRDGRRTKEPEPVVRLRERCTAQIRGLPAALRQISRTARYPVIHSPGLKKMLASCASRASGEIAARGPSK